MQAGITLWVKSEWRRRSRATLTLVLLVGIAGAVVLTAVAGSRRTASSFDRFTSESLSADVIADLGAVDPVIVETIARLPMVETSGSFTVVFALVDGVDADLAILAPGDAHAGVLLERDRVLRGRRPDPAQPDEVAVNEAAASLVGVDVGDQITIATMTPAQVTAEEYFPARGPLLRFDVVGVLRGPDDLNSRAEGAFIASQAFLDTVHGQVDEYTTFLAIELAEGALAADFETTIGQLIPPDQGYGTISLDVRSRAARGTISSIAQGLAFFGLVATLAALVATGQSVGRHVASGRGDARILLQLGFTRTDRTVALVLMTLPAALCSAALASVAAWLTSSIMPIGLARRADPNLGPTADWTVLLGGALAVTVAVLVSALVAATWMTRPRSGAILKPGPSAMVAAVSRAGLGPVAANGVRLAIDRRGPALPVRSAIAGVAVAILGVFAVLTFSSSLDRLLVSPDRWGYDWDLLLNVTSGEVGTAVAGVAGDDRLTAVAQWDAGFSYVEGEGIRAYGLDPVAGDIGFSLLSGRQPATPAEVVLGPDTADRLGARLGDRVRVAADSVDNGRPSVVVVGTALFPDDGDEGFSNAIGYFGAAFEEHSIVPDSFEANQLVVRVAPGLDIDDVAASLDAEYPDSVSGESLPAQPGPVANLSSVRSLPLWLAAFVALLGIASLGHVLLTTLWRRRLELGTLRSLGLTPRQAFLCVVWQALAVTLLGLVIGAPLGMALGRQAWFAVANPINVATDVAWPRVLLGSAIVAALAVAALVAVVPGLGAARLRVAEALRVA